MLEIHYCICFWDEPRHSCQKKSDWFVSFSGLLSLEKKCNYKVGKSILWKLIPVFLHLLALLFVYSCLISSHVTIKQNRMMKPFMTCFLPGNRGKHPHLTEFCCTMTTSTSENMLCKCWWRWYQEWPLIMRLTSCRRHIIMD